MEPRSQHHEELLDRAERAIGGAVTFKLPRQETAVIARGEGSKLWDVDGRMYIDYLLGSGPMLVGHANPKVVEAVMRQVALGSTYYSLNRPAIELAERLIEAAPCAEFVKYVS